MVTAMLKEAWDKLLNRDVRHITFGGDPLYEPLHKRFWRSAHFKVAMGTAVVMSADAVSRNIYEDAAFYISLNAMSYALTEMFNFSRSADDSLRIGDDYCIDKNGKLALLTGASSAKNFAQAAKWVYSFSAFMIMSVGNGFISRASDPVRGSIDAALLLPIIAAPLAMAYRYHKVSTGEWAIVKKPPKQEVRQEQELKAPGTVPDIA